MTPKGLQDVECTINMNGTILNQTNTVKLLGLHIDSNLNWQNQTTELLRKLAFKVGIICRLSKLLPIKLLNTIYRTIF